MTHIGTLVSIIVIVLIIVSVLSTKRSDTDQEGFVCTTTQNRNPMFGFITIGDEVNKHTKNMKITTDGRLDIKTKNSDPDMLYFDTNVNMKIADAHEFKANGESSHTGNVSADNKIKVGNMSIKSGGDSDTLEIMCQSVKIRNPNTNDWMTITPGTNNSDSKIKWRRNNNAVRTLDKNVLDMVSHTGTDESTPIDDFTITKNMTMENATLSTGLLKSLATTAKNFSTEGLTLRKATSDGWSKAFTTNFEPAEDTDNQFDINTTQSSQEWKIRMNEDANTEISNTKICMGSSECLTKNRLKRLSGDADAYTPLSNSFVYIHTDPSNIKDIPMRYRRDVFVLAQAKIPTTSVLTPLQIYQATTSFNCISACGWDKYDNYDYLYLERNPKSITSARRSTHGTYLYDRNSSHIVNHPDNAMFYLQRAGSTSTNIINSGEQVYIKWVPGTSLNNNRCRLDLFHGDDSEVIPVGVPHTGYPNYFSKWTIQKVDSNNNVVSGQITRNCNVIFTCAGPNKKNRRLSSRPVTSTPLTNHNGCGGQHLGAITDKVTQGITGTEIWTLYNDDVKEASKSLFLNSNIKNSFTKQENGIYTTDQNFDMLDESTFGPSTEEVKARTVRNTTAKCKALVPGSIVIPTNVSYSPGNCNKSTIPLKDSSDRLVFPPFKWKDHAVEGYPDWSCCELVTQTTGFCPAGTNVYHNGSHCCNVNVDKNNKPISYTSQHCKENNGIDCPYGAVDGKCKNG